MLGTFLKKSIIAVFVFSNFLVVGCGINPVTGKREFQLVSERAEINIGKESYSKMLQSQGGKYKGDPELNRYVAKVGQRLAMVSDRPQLPYEFVVINDSTPNAWALPGGKIGVNRGLLVELENEAELAAVLGHEIVHAAARHTANRMQQGIFLQVGMAGIATLSIHDACNTCMYINGYVSYRIYSVYVHRTTSSNNDSAIHRSFEASFSKEKI